MSKYYEPSGKFSPMAFAYLVLTSVVVLPILSAIYAYLIWYIPIIYLNLLVVVGFGFAVAIATRLLIVRLGKVRNYGLAVIFSIIASLVAYYLQWVVWADLAANAGEVYGNSRIGISVSNVRIEELLYLLANPQDLFALIGEINQYGTWAIKSNTVSGGFLTAVWVIEFLIIIVIGFLGSVSSAKEPFSEINNEWFKEETLLAYSFIEDADTFKRNAEQNQWEALESLSVIGERVKQESHSVFTLYHSGTEYYLSVTNAKATLKKDKVEFDKEDFIEYLRISREIYNTLKAKQ